MEKNSVKSFFDNYFFYKKSKEEKTKIQSKIMQEDHMAYKVLLLVIFCLQIVMLVFSFISYGIVPDPNKPWALTYRILYTILALSCIIAYLLIRYAYQSKKPFFYFVIVSCTMVIIHSWSAGITILDSHSVIDLTTFSYVSAILSVVLILEPWITTLNMLGVTLALNLFLFFNPTTASLYTLGTLINSVSIFIISVVATTFIFYRRIKKLNLEIEINKLNELLAEKAIKDDLTGLFNRHYLTQNINDPLNYGKESTGLIMLDIDNFKSINDTYGHRMGDLILSQVGKIILDFTGNNEYAIRYGGEEFLIYIPRISKEELKKRGEEIRKLMENCTIDISADDHINFTVSVGLSTATSNISYSGLISHSDKALYKAKETKNSVFLYEDK